MSYHEEAYRKIEQEENKAEWTHELLSAAAGFAAMRAYNKKKEEEGANPENDHHLAKQMIAALAAASVDHLVETKGMDWVDRHKAKKEAEEEAKKLYTEKTGYEF
ncbi:hypothetical protein G6F70_005870 [Rhizopus microsporus]|uniref:CipC-like antibiotic response protein n=2 Tax=Rhizopus TaxID=4842 RepID=A0A367KBU5_RHIAZ|nr:hypothetical protein G6F71_005515 [Rhizopus microsporus]RCH99647.1 hypothetical protein CU097_013706 [Rhizopus azygosporus]KAG1198353.1 hypothetical protein G6F70_005870 [Rhizopus microsporus]KAG1210171.1 hypothetical protein G6F69_005715 [Rhizopus microsporus]KAG1232152.1 hypothetical protein G6F67_005227 [Rhizopus microsporus]